MLICQNCRHNFTFTTTDLDFYEKMAVPQPKNCPTCRYQQRLAFRNERKFYKRTCSASGQEIISIFSAEKTMPVYSQSYWWSDNWDAKSYGRDFDFNRSFFSQFEELFNQVPQLALSNYESENSEYTNQSERNKNCYLVVASSHNEDCLYGMWFQNSRNSIDCLYLEQSELCYEVINGTNCYNCTFSQNIEQSSDVHYSKNLIGCHNCFGCINLRNKEYYIFNQPYSKDQYFQILPQIQKQFHDFHTFYLKHPHKYYTGKNNQNFSGDYIQEAKDSFNVYNCRYSENTNYSFDAWKCRNSRDLTETLENDWCLEIEGCERNVDIAFCMKLHNTHSSRYSAHCYFSKHLFGCVGLRRNEYCILNKQYSKEEYQDLVPRIIKHMQKTSQWGEYFPKSISPFGYNETVAQEYFPLTQEQALKQGYTWKEETPRTTTATTQILLCEISGKTFKIIPQELNFYQKMNLPIPKRCPEQRHLDRMNMRNPRFLQQRACQFCQKPLQSTFSQIQPEIIYCEACYLTEAVI